MSPDHVSSQSPESTGSPRSTERATAPPRAPSGRLAALVAVAATGLLVMALLAATGDAPVDGLAAFGGVLLFALTAAAVILLRRLLGAAARLEAACAALTPHGPAPTAESLARLQYDAWRLAEAIDVEAPGAPTQAAAIGRGQRHHDLLTGLPSRTLLGERLREAIPASLQQQREIALCAMKLQGLDAAEDRLGGRAADRVRRVLAERLQNGLRGNDIVARLDGDIYLLALTQLEDRSACHEILERLYDLVQMRVALDEGESVQVTAALGVAFCPEDEDHAERLLELALDRMAAAHAAAHGGFASTTVRA